MDIKDDKLRKKLLIKHNSKAILLKLKNIVEISVWNSNAWVDSRDQLSPFLITKRWGFALSGIDTKVCFINLQKEGISLKETGSSDKRWKICPSLAFLIWFLKRVNGSGHIKPVQSIWMISTFLSFVKLSKQDNYRCSEEKI